MALMPSASIAKVLVSTENMDTEEWLKWRNKGIGGSDSSIICGINQYKAPMELWMEKTGRIQPVETGEATYWGHVMEPIIREEFTKRTGLEVQIEKAILQHPDHYFMLANLDGIISDPEYGDCVFEAKTASTYNAPDWELDVPENYQLQVQHYLSITGFMGAYIAVLIGGNQFKYYFIQRDDELIQLLIKLEARFWDCVVHNKPPKIDGSKASTDLLSRLYPKGKSSKTIILPDEALLLIQQHEHFQEEEGQALLKKDEAANKLKEMLGEHACGSVSGRLISWTNVSSEKLNARLLKSEQPELYAKYALTSNYRRFSIK